MLYPYAAGYASGYDIANPFATVERSACAAFSDTPGFNRPNAVSNRVCRFSMAAADERNGHAAVVM
jgi:hypothetical protein